MGRNPRGWCWRAVGLSLAIGLASLPGCGHSGRGGREVSGTVMLDSQPMPAGSIVFVPMVKGHKAAGEIVAGSFRIGAGEGPISGDYRVEIYGPDESGVPWDDPIAYTQSGVQWPGPNPVAPQFNTQSRLTANVTAAGDNRFTFQVESARR